ncbi:histidinol-phosphate transaminase [Hydrogenovibrio halophilus]|uniref:histidinol-phosphate transaminase n=1 Tax=Hydrogenovibrio halophilus TaxID=373391 RepID=UPI00036D52C5|nr:histidinol-phosphate transaminase [Hydrogenovibrio halophilus]
MPRFWNPTIDALTPYTPGEQPKVANLVKLNTNESPYPPAPGVLDAIHAATDDALRLYPDPNATPLKQALADYYRLSTDQVFVGNGSDEVLAHAFLGLLKHEVPLRFPDISYSFYPVYCGLYGIAPQKILLDPTLAIDPDDYQGDSGPIIFPNPNAPTGRLLTLDQITRILQQNPSHVVVVDEAYIDFGGESATQLIARYPNLLVTQTFSKSRALAGLRLGMAFGQAHLIEALERVKNSFNSYPVDRLAMAAGIASLQEEAYFAESCRKVMATRQALTEFLQEKGFDVVPSHANFVFARHPEHSASELAQQLRDRAIIVRYFDKPRIDQYLRISIGSEEENRRLCDALSEILG